MKKIFMIFALLPSFALADDTPITMQDLADRASMAQAMESPPRPTKTTSQILADQAAAEAKAEDYCPESCQALRNFKVTSMPSVATDAARPAPSTVPSVPSHVTYPPVQSAPNPYNQTLANPDPYPVTREHNPTCTTTPDGSGGLTTVCY